VAAVTSNGPIGPDRREITVEPLPEQAPVAVTVKVVDTNGRCLSAFCPNPAAYIVQMSGDWWWPECVEHTAGMRAKLVDYVTGVRIADA
jgi:hypothetical protein